MDTMINAQDLRDLVVEQTIASHHGGGNNKLLKVVVSLRAKSIVYHVINDNSLIYKSEFLQTAVDTYNSITPT